MPTTTTNLALRKPLATDPPDGAGAIANLADDLESLFGRTAAAIGSLPAGTRYGQRAVVGTVEARWNGTAWRAYDSEQIPWASTWGGGIGGTGNLGGFYRFTGGRIAIEQTIVAGANSNGSLITATLPLPARQVQMYGGGASTQGGWWANGRGNLFNNSRDYDLALAFESGAAVRFGFINLSDRGIDTLGTNQVVAGGHQIRFQLIYEPA